MNSSATAAIPWNMDLSLSAAFVVSGRVCQKDRFLQTALREQRHKARRETRSLGVARSLVAWVTSPVAIQDKVRHKNLHEFNFVGIRPL